MRSFILTVKNTDDGSECSSRVQFPEGELTSLVAFADAADELAAAGVMRQDLRVQIKIKFDVANGANFSGTLPDNDVISALLHRVRPFVLAKEPTSFLRIRNMLARRVDNAEMRKILDRQRDLFTGKDFQEQIEIVTTTPVLRDVLNSDESFHAWLNAFEYHRDAAKRTTIEQLCGVLGFEAARAIFVSMLLDKVKAIMNLAAIIRRCEQADGRPLKVKS
jgi:hypothetical protein